MTIAPGTEFKRALVSLGDNDVDGFGSAVLQEHGLREKVANYFRDPVEALGQVYTCLKIVNSPSTAPVSLATLQLVNSAMTSLTQTTYMLGTNIDGLSDQVGNIRDFYKRLDLQNSIPDGTAPFPENEQDISLGISVEFRNVTFKYSEKDDLVLKNVSFKIEQGQLCVSLQHGGNDEAGLTHDSDSRSSLGRTVPERARYST